jgi:hypothetical protein
VAPVVSGEQNPVAPVGARSLDDPRSPFDPSLFHNDYIFEVQRLEESDRHDMYLSTLELEFNQRIAPRRAFLFFRFAIPSNNSLPSVIPDSFC